MHVRKILLLVFFFIPNLIAAQKRPNIIYIMADALGYADLSCYGSLFLQRVMVEKRI